MTNAQYLHTQDQLSKLAGLIDSMDLENFVRRINLADTVGPILDPTLYRHAMHNLAAYRDLAMAASRFQQEARSAIERLNLTSEAS